jgi:hypothetical protein
MKIELNVYDTHVKYMINGSVSSEPFVNKTREEILNSLKNRLKIIYGDVVTFKELYHE